MSPFLVDEGSPLDSFLLCNKCISRFKPLVTPVYMKKKLVLSLLDFGVAQRGLT